MPKSLTNIEVMYHYITSEPEVLTEMLEHLEDKEIDDYPVLRTAITAETFKICYKAGNPMTCELYPESIQAAVAGLSYTDIHNLIDLIMAELNQRLNHKC